MHVQDTAKAGYPPPSPPRQSRRPLRRSWPRLPAEADTWSRWDLDGSTLRSG